MFTALAWMPDGREIIVLKWVEGTKGGYRGSELWSVSAEGENPRCLGLRTFWMAQPRVHPDGKRLVFSASPHESKKEVWVMDNFLPSG